MKTIKAVLFDLDGTLVDTEGQYSVFWGSIGRQYRPDIPDFENIIKGSTLKRIYENYFPDPQLQAEITARLDEWEAQMDYRFFPGALDFVRDLKSHGVKCAIVTSSNKPKMRSVLRQHPDFNTLFDHVLTSEDFSASKPDPACYLLGAQVCQAELSECVVFEDAFNGLQSGMSSGIFTMGIASYNSPESIAPLCHHVLMGYEGLTYRQLCRIADEEERVRQARDYFLQGYNCSQAVAMTFADLYGIQPGLMSRLSASFGGGIGRMRETCGAACGMFLLAGLDEKGQYPEAKGHNYEIVQQLAEAFRAQTGSLLCRELLGLNKKRADGSLPPISIIPTPEARTAEYYRTRPCLRMVETAVRIYCQYLS